MRDLISIIVPVYNVEKYLRKCLESLRLQTYKNMEFILVDDGSQDKSGEICDEYTKKDQRFLVIHKEHEGVLIARNNGIELANGKYIGFVDSDDWVNLEMYERMKAAICMKDIQIVICKKNIYNDEQKTYYEEKDCLPDGKYMSTSSILTSKLFLIDSVQELSLNLYDKLFDRKLIINNYKKVDKRLHYFEDIVLTIRCIMQANTILVLNHPFYFYRQRQFSLCHSIEKKYLEQISIFYNSLLDITSCDLELQSRLDKFIADRVIHGFNYKMDIKLERKIPYWIPPFQEIYNETRVVLYGAGEVGRSYYQMFQYVNPEQIVLWVDKKSIELRKEGLPVEAVSTLLEIQFNKVLIAVKFENHAMQIRDELRMIGIAEEKMIWFQPKSILA